jgi:hypothetical protein
MKDKYYPPVHAQGQFHCPNCNVYAKQYWSHLRCRPSDYSLYRKSDTSIFGLPGHDGMLPETVTISICHRCSGFAFWNHDVMIFPQAISVENPNQDLPEDIQKDYWEAARILSDSPRASAALLRLALQKLCKYLGGEGKHIDTDIKSFVNSGLNLKVLKALDSLRIVGNNAVHPGNIDLEDSPEVALKLFSLLNFVAEKMITEQKEIDAFYDDLPDGSKNVTTDDD